MTGKRRTTSTNSAQEAKPEWDFSLLRQPIEMGVPPGAMQVVKGIQSGNREIQELLLYECDIIYECKVCRNLFRGLTNLVAHKRVYCTATYQEARMQLMDSILESETVTVEPRSPSQDQPMVAKEEEDIACVEREKDDANESDSCKYGESDKKMNSDPGNGEDGICRTATPSSCESGSTVFLHSEPKAKGISALAFYSKMADMVEKDKAVVPTSSVILEPIPGNSNAMFQSFKSSVTGDCEEEEDDTSDEEADLLKPLSPPARVKTRSLTSCEEPPVAVVEPKEAKGHLRMNLRQRNHGNGGQIETPIMQKLNGNSDCDIKTLRCLKCEMKFSSIKTLHFHMMSHHSEKRTLYPCLFCDKSFMHFPSAVRHVELCHRKSKEQMSKIKTTIKKRAFTKAVDSLSVGKRSTRSASFDPMEKATEKWKENGKVSEGGRLSTKRSGAKGYYLSADFTILKCKNCDSVFHKQESLDRHSSFCIEVKTSKQDEDGSSSNSSRSTSKSKRMIKVKTPEADFETSSNVPVPRRVSNDHDDLGKISESATKEKEVSMVKESKQRRSHHWKDIKLSKHSPINEKNMKRISVIVDVNKLLCLKCGITCGTIYSLHRHAIRHLDLRRYKCRLCKFAAYDRSECNTHLRRMHPNHIRGLDPLKRRKLVLDLSPEKDSSFLLSKSLLHSHSQKKRCQRSTVSNQRLQRSKAGINRANIHNHQKSIFNISTRKNPRTFDTSPYRPVDQMSILTTRSGFYVKPKRPLTLKSSSSDEEENVDESQRDENLSEHKIGQEHCSEDDRGKVQFEQESVCLMEVTEEEDTVTVPEDGTNLSGTLVEDTQQILHSEPGERNEFFSSVGDTVCDSNIVSDEDVTCPAEVSVKSCREQEGINNNTVICVTEEQVDSPKPVRLFSVQSESGSVLEDYTISENFSTSSQEEISEDQSVTDILVKPCNQSSNKDLEGEVEIPHPVMMSDASGKVIMMTSFDDSSDLPLNQSVLGNSNSLDEGHGQTSENFEPPKLPSSSDGRIIDSVCSNTTPNVDLIPDMPDVEVENTISISAGVNVMKYASEEDTNKSPPECGNSSAIDQIPFPCQIHQNISISLSESNTSLPSDANNLSGPEVKDCVNILENVEKEGHRVNIFEENVEKESHCVNIFEENKKESHCVTILENVEEGHCVNILEENAGEEGHCVTILDENVEEGHCVNILEENVEKEGHCVTILEEDVEKEGHCVNILEENVEKEGHCVTILEEDVEKESHCVNILEENVEKEGHCVNILEENVEKEGHCVNILEENVEKEGHCVTILEEDVEKESHCVNILEENVEKEGHCVNILEENVEKEGVQKHEVSPMNIECVEHKRETGEVDETEEQKETVLMVVSVPEREKHEQDHGDDMDVLDLDKPDIMETNCSESSRESPPLEHDVHNVYILEDSGDVMEVTESNPTDRPSSSGDTELENTKVASSDMVAPDTEPVSMVTEVDVESGDIQPTDSIQVKVST